MTRNNHTTYAVILPHYNSFGLLRRALDSIPVRDDIQVLVIDDLSTEPSIQEISRESAYSHVDFFFSEKKITAGGARNIGLDHAKGEYVLFADSDDYFTKNAFELFDEKVSSQHDLIQFTVTSFFEGTDRVGTRHEYLHKIYKDKGLSRYLAIEQPYGKLIKREFIEEYRIRFSAVPAGNDVYFSTKVAIFSRKRMFISHVVYAVSQSDFSITATKTVRNSCSRIGEQIKKVQLVRCTTPIWFWSIYLLRRNIYPLTRRYIDEQHTCSPDLVALSKEYQKVMPRIVHIIYRWKELTEVTTDLKAS